MARKYTQKLEIRVGTFLMFPLVPFAWLIIWAFSDDGEEIPSLWEALKMQWEQVKAGEYI